VFAAQWFVIKNGVLSGQKLICFVFHSFGGDPFLSVSQRLGLWQ
jgi:hypothetical protein